MISSDTATWREAADFLGWRWSNACGGYISEHHRQRRGEERHTWGSYEVAEDAEEACFWDGLETISQAQAFVEQRRGIR